MAYKFFPIKTEPACALKWNWSTLYMNSGQSACCHRTGYNPLTAENFDDFHNNPKVIEERSRMLNGQWPTDSCGYCRGIESAGGFSDRMYHLGIPDQVPAELDQNLNALVVTPTILEIFFSNVCNMACLYCIPSLSSGINQENLKFGKFSKNNVILEPEPVVNCYDEIASKLWQWLDRNSTKLRRLNVAGGEPTYQPQFFKTLEFLESRAHPNLEFEIITNLKVKQSRLEDIVNRLKKLVVNRQLKRVDIVCSIDCWGAEQEYVRYGVDLAQWEQNFKFLAEQKWIKLSINQTISALTVKSMPELLRRLQEWRVSRPVGHSFSGVTGTGPDWLKVDIFGPGVFDKDFETILSLMPTASSNDLSMYKCMEGISTFAKSSPCKNDELLRLWTYLEEKDRRRGTCWKEVFPWLEEEFKKCGIIK